VVFTVVDERSPERSAETAPDSMGGVGPPDHRRRALAGGLGDRTIRR
jgi:hypothetical protein